MHGRLKVRTTEEQRLIKEKENQKKLAAYRMGMKHILATRKDDSYDPTAFATSAQILTVNPDIYTLWNYRKEVILMKIKDCKQYSECDQASGDKEPETEEELITFLENELRLTEQCLVANPKSYSSWHHRYWILERHLKPNWQHELNLVTKYLTLDDRNFHCWDYRRQILSKVETSFEDELKFSTERINVNFSNYSSWHYRSTLRKLDKDSVDAELTLVENAVFTDPFDSSAWFYLRWVLSHPDITKERKENLLDAFDQLQDLEPSCKWVLLAKCWLTGSLRLNDLNQADGRISLYEMLMKLDPMRKGQYEDYLRTAENTKN